AVAPRSAARRGAGDELASERVRLALEPLDQLLERFLEARDAVHEELGGYVLHGDAGCGELAKERALTIEVLVDRSTHFAMIAKCLDGLRRHRVDGVGTDQSLDV